MVGRLVGAEGVRRLSMQALLLLGLAIFVSGVVMFVYDLSLPYAGFEVAGVTGVGAIDPGGPAESAGLLMEDRILDIQGPGAPGAAYLRPDQETLRLTVLRDGQELSLDIGLISPPPKVTLNKVGYYVMTLAFWIIAMIALLFKPRDPVSQLFVLVALLGTLGIVVWRMADTGALWANLTMPAIVLILGPLFVHYHTVFPERISFRSKKALLAVLYGCSLILLPAAETRHSRQLAPESSSNTESVIACPDRLVPAARNVTGVEKRLASCSIFCNSASSITLITSLGIKR